MTNEEEHRLICAAITLLLANLPESKLPLLEAQLTMAREQVGKRNWSGVAALLTDLFWTLGIHRLESRRDEPAT